MGDAMRKAAVLAVIGAALVGPATLLSGTALADPPLRGELVAAATHGQPVCATRQALSDYTLATIRREPLRPVVRNPSCSLAPYGTRVTVLEDLPPFGSRMHMVRVVAATPLQRVEGYTWSVGLYDPRRFTPFAPSSSFGFFGSLGDYFPRIP